MVECLLPIMHPLKSLNTFLTLPGTMKGSFLEITFRDLMVLDATYMRTYFMIPIFIDNSWQSGFARSKLLIGNGVTFVITIITYVNLRMYASYKFTWHVY